MSQRTEPSSSLFADALRKIAETADCVPSMVGGCVGATLTVYRYRNGEPYTVEVVNCPKHYAAQVLAEADE